ncbi:hypothetical protein N7478_007091 [Penicillium angulare]|uniref:uncharacterized protein n=1 Tax=Penicillium angulare TaxID=116970 RepID=UPI002541A802|nr:uncharacterized protein N7478_007091 [Penicillium angulare]KAJ5281719.1 hypothetical protein N7478_007091 [Penicillium angulare]
MRSSTKTRPNIRPNIRTNPDRRYSARYLILVYHGTRAHFDPLEIQRLVAGEQAKCTIVRQSEDDNIFNYFAFIDFSGKRFQTRNLAFFDIQQYHPKWIHVTSSPWQKLDEMMAQGDVLWNGIDRPNKRPSADRRKHATGKPPSSGQWELLGSVTDEASFEELLRKEMSRNESESEDPLIEDFEYEVNPEDGQTEMARNVQYWQDGYRAGYKAATSKFAAHQTPDKNFSKYDICHLN